MLKYVAIHESQIALNGSLIAVITGISTESGWILIHISSPAAYNEMQMALLSMPKCSCSKDNTEIMI